MRTLLCPITGEHFTPTMDEPAVPVTVYRQMRQGRRRWTEKHLEPVSYAAATTSPMIVPEDNDVWWTGLRDVSGNISVCAVCGIPVLLRDDPRRKVAYCGDKCRRAYYRQQRATVKPDPVCDTCGNTFRGRSDARYCSPKCRQAAYRKRAR